MSKVKTPNPFPFKTAPGASAKPLTAEQAKLLFTEQEIAAGEKRGEMEHRGPWQILTRYRALATSQDLTRNDGDYSERPLTIYGVRSLDKPTECGYELEGRVSISGKTYRGFTSSQLFELPDGKLMSCAIIHVCLDQEK